jgi:enamine deaminase RidA (YjgF/YER057c/UK114 family)
VRVGDRILVSGTAPIGPDGACVGPGDAYLQARRCLAILVEAIEALGGRAGDVVRTRIYLTRPEDWDPVGRAHGEVFGSVRPAATMVVVAKLLDPAWLVEIEAEAQVGGGT